MWKDSKIEDVDYAANCVNFPQALLFVNARRKITFGAGYLFLYSHYCTNYFVN